MSKYKRGDIHPNKDLIFYQYHHPYYKKTYGEVWLSQEEYNKRVLAHSVSTSNYRAKYPLMSLTSNAIQRDKAKYKTSKDELIDVEYITEKWNQQKGLCYWYNFNMDVNKLDGKDSRNPLKVTIDRLDNKIGYLKSNIVLCSYAANCGRGNMSVNEWIEAIKIIKNGLNRIK